MDTPSVPGTEGWFQPLDAAASTWILYWLILCNGGMILAGENKRPCSKFCPIVAISPTVTTCSILAGTFNKWILIPDYLFCRNGLIVIINLNEESAKYRSCTPPLLSLQRYVRGGTDKSLARPGRKQATATRLGIYSTYSPRSSIHFLARCSTFCKSLKKIQNVVRPTRSPRQQWPPCRKKNDDRSIVFFQSR